VEFSIIAIYSHRHHLRTAVPRGELHAGGPGHFIRQ
jgi:hypothetical protein